MCLCQNASMESLFECFQCIRHAIVLHVGLGYGMLMIRFCLTKWLNCVQLNCIQVDCVQLNYVDFVIKWNVRNKSDWSCRCQKS